jgi:hypothetical protein
VILNWRAVRGQCRACKRGRPHCFIRVGLSAMPRPSCTRRIRRHACTIELLPAF